MNKLRVGFIGLGLMGNPMAKNILKAGFPLSVYNRTRSKTEEFKQLGADVYDSPALLAENVDVVISMVTAPKDVLEVYLGEDGVSKGAHPGLVAIDMSTIGPKAAKEVGQGLNNAGVEFLDAPVGGSVNRAQEGSLVVMVGGKEGVFDNVKEVLEALGSATYIGDTGKGQAMKLVNNLVGAITVAALAEGMVLAERLGLKRTEVEEVLSKTTHISGTMAAKMPFMVKDEYPVSFSFSNMRKDLGLALKENPSLPLLEATEKLYEEGMEKGLEDEDYSAVLKVIEQIL